MCIRDSQEGPKWFQREPRWLQDKPKMDSKGATSSPKMRCTTLQKTLGFPRFFKETTYIGDSKWPYFWIFVTSMAWHDATCDHMHAHMNPSWPTWCVIRGHGAHSGASKGLIGYLDTLTREVRNAFLEVKVRPRAELGGSRLGFGSEVLKCNMSGYIEVVYRQIHVILRIDIHLSLIHISEPTRPY